MAFIQGSLRGGDDIRGTADDDVILAFGGHNTITDTGGSNRVVSGLLGHDEIHLGTMLDGHSEWMEQVLLTGAGNTLLGGDERFEVIGLRGGNAITLGNGTNRLRLGGENNAVQVGSGENDITFAGGHGSVVQGSPLYANYGDVTVHFSGTGNSYDVLNSGSLLPRTNITIAGGEGDGRFNLFANGSATLRTDGLHNDVTVGIGHFDIDPGDGYDTVHLGATGRSGGGTGTVWLHGLHNTITGAGGDLTVNGGDGYTSIALNGVFQARIDATLGGTHNTVSIASIPATGSIDTGFGDASVSLYGNDATLTFRGSGNVATLDNAGGGTILDQSDGLRINVDGQPSSFFFQETVQGFGADRGAVVALEDSVTGYTTAQQAVAALRAEGGDTVLDLPDGGHLVFAGLDPSALHDSNFLVV
ncbi:MAG: hypothetical protein DI601_04140 [Azospirillum brasilense]|nr:MAG: hypothetical protein DI601_04140 [Azospirillum brasilense]